MKRVVSGIMAVCAAIGWWGALYPQFTLVEGTYRIVNEDESAIVCEDITQPELNGSRLYWSLLNEECSNIKFKSRLLTDWREFHESGNQ